MDCSLKSGLAGLSCAFPSVSNVYTKPSGSATSAGSKPALTSSRILRGLCPLRFSYSAEIFVKAPELRICADAPLQQLDAYFRLPRAARWRFAQEHRAETIGHDQVGIESRG